MSQLTALKSDNTRLNALLTEAQESNQKHTKQLDRVKILRGIVRAKIHGTEHVLETEPLTDDQLPFFQTMLIAYRDIDTLLDKTMDTDIDLIEYAMKNPTG